MHPGILYHPGWCIFLWHILQYLSTGSLCYCSHSSWMSTSTCYSHNSPFSGSSWQLHLLTAGGTSTELHLWRLCGIHTDTEELFAFQNTLGDLQRTSVKHTDSPPEGTWALWDVFFPHTHSGLLRLCSYSVRGSELLLGNLFLDALFVDPHWFWGGCSSRFLNWVRKGRYMSMCEISLIYSSAEHPSTHSAGNQTLITRISIQNPPFWQTL